MRNRPFRGWWRRAEWAIVLPMNTQSEIALRSASYGRRHGETAQRSGRRLRDRWPACVGYLAAAWSAGYSLLAVWWLAGHPGLPAVLARPSGAADAVNWGVLERLGAGTVATLAFASVFLALRLTRRIDRGRSGVALAAAAWSLAATLLVGVPNARIVAVMAYTPAFVFGAPFGWPPVDFVEVIPWPVLNQVICLQGGIVWGLTALVSSRRTRGACPACGRHAGASRWTSPEAAARWGMAATCVAVVVPLLYAATRLAWAAGIPLGITETFLRNGQAIGMWKAGAALAAVAIAGAWLTIGLVRPWGEVFPRWIPLLRGRRVPPFVAIAPAAAMSCLFVAAGLGAVGAFVQDGLPEDGWGTTAPLLLWPVWGLALATATLAYHYRRRGRCRQCGRV